jgi:hypothetical protein
MSKRFSNQKFISQIKQNSKISNELYEVSQLQEIFHLYSNNDKYLTNKQYSQFLSDAQLIDNDLLSIKYSNVLFYSFTKAKNNLNFQSFCDLIIKLTELKFQEEFMINQATSLSKFIETYITPLIKILKSNPLSNNNKVNNTNSTLPMINYQLLISKIGNRLNKEIFEGNYLLFAKVYLKYFCFERLKISNQQKNHLSSRAFCKVMRDFEICPYYITIEQINEVYENIILNKDLVLENMIKSINTDMCSNEGMFYTLYHFMASFYLLAVNNILFTNNEEEKNNLWQIFVKGSDSEALNGLIKILYKSQNLKNIMPNEINQAENEYNNNMNSNNNLIDGNNEINNSNNEIPLSSQSNLKSSISRMNIEKYNTNPNKKIIDDYSNQTTEIKTLPHEGKLRILKVKEMAPEIVRKYYDTLTSIYKFYSELYYETIFSIYMTQNGFIKFIRDMGLVSNNYNQIENSKVNDTNVNLTEMYLNNKLKANLLSFSTLNFYFSKFSTNSKGIIQKNNNKRIDFENFVYIILCLANKIYNPQFNSISYENKSFPIEILTMSEFPIKYANAFIDNYVIPLYTDIKTFVEEESFTFENLNLLFDSMKNYINKIISLLIRILKVYSDGKDYIDYNQYFKFLCDFEIFPDLISRTRMIKIFIHFIDNFDREYVIKGNNKILLTLERCAKAILFIGIGGSDKKNNKSDSNEVLINLIYFLQRMGQTQGIKNVSLISGNISTQRDFIKYVENLKNKIIPSNYNTEEKNFSDLI